MTRVLPFWRRRPAASEFEDLLRPHVEHLYRLAHRFTGRASDAEDLVQEVLVKLYPRTRELKGIEQLRPWLSRVLYRQFVDSVRKRGRSPIDQPATDASEDGDALERLPSEEEGPEERVERSLRQEHILRAFDQLNSEQRALLALHDIEGYSLEELEITLETPLGTLKSRLHRARLRLRTLLPMEPFAASRRVSK